MICNTSLLISTLCSNGRSSAAADENRENDRSASTPLSSPSSAHSISKRGLSHAHVYICTCINFVVLFPALFVSLFLWGQKRVWSAPWWTDREAHPRSPLSLRGATGGRATHPEALTGLLRVTSHQRAPQCAPVTGQNELYKRSACVCACV